MNAKWSELNKAMQKLLKKQDSYKDGISTIIAKQLLILFGIYSFSNLLDLEELYQYILDVKDSTNDLLNNLSYQDLKRKFSDNDKEQLKKLGVVS